MVEWSRRSRDLDFSGTGSLRDLLSPKIPFGSLCSSSFHGLRIDALFVVQTPPSQVETAGLAWWGLARIKSLRTSPHPEGKDLIGLRVPSGKGREREVSRSFGGVRYRVGRRKKFRGWSPAPRPSTLHLPSWRPSEDSRGEPKGGPRNRGGLLPEASLNRLPPTYPPSRPTGPSISVGRLRGRLPRLTARRGALPRPESPGPRRAPAAALAASVQARGRDGVGPALQ